MEWMETHSRHILDNIGKIFLPGIIDNEKVGNHLVNMRWSVIEVAQSNYDLLTSDRPYIQTLGLSDSASVVAFPLSPCTLFLATNAQAREQQVLRFGESRLVKAVNHHVASQAMRHVYGRSMSHKEFVEKRLGLNPPKDPLP